jgi:hypothetical protein
MPNKHRKKSKKKRLAQKENAAGGRWRVNLPASGAVALML